ncbi:16S rRNA (guanine(527)-N(7))-methyltransferase RsmG [Eubacterium ramulus]|jgi:16S rRNA (guanine527-N7)-methyltransferase|uniref:16S rRNA (guanine(527)-N(7))-methyltransferase RsmG n=1 Tax=Eubacterium ramulus TaxID=39490 RepID=UPI0022E3E841|nr:16S rRNA (guanine(527)-N(7))-methyltransferase RsmG [Eubacterium ramulus]
MSYDLTKFKHGLEELNITLTDEQIEQFLQYYEMLVEKNKVMNLTGITEYEEVIQKHFLDSLSLIRVIPDIASQKLTVIDLGTGAGFPGIPLKIAFPELEITLMDSLNKRILFLQEVIDALGQKKVSAVHGRAEEMSSNATHRQQYDLCVSRAVSNLAVLTEYCLPFVKKGGLFVSYKSADSDAEIQEGKKAISILGGKLTSVDKFQLPDSDLRRALVCIKKVKDTPKKYPRKAGTPAKLPLK